MSRSAVRDVSRGSFYLGLEQLTMAAGGVFYLIIVLRMLGPATYGILNLGLAAIGLAGVLTTNIETYLERFVGELDARGSSRVLRPLLKKILLTKSMLAVVAGLLVVLLADPIATAYGYRDLRRLIPALAPLILLEGIGYSMRVTLFGLQRFRSIWIVALGNNLLKLGIVFALWRLNEGVVALVAGLVLVQLLTVIGNGVLIHRFLPSGSVGDAQVPSYRKIWNYVLPLLGARVFFLSGQHLNRLILGALLPARELGIAAFALMTIDRFISLAAAVPNSLLPALSRLRGEGRDATIEQVVTEGFRVVAALSVLVTAGVFCFAREAVWITGGREYLTAILPLQILALTPLFRTMQQPLSMGFYTYEKTRTVFWLAGLKFAIEPLCYPLLIPRFGLAGVALASLLSSVVVFGPSMKLADRLFAGSVRARRGATLSAWSIGIGVAIAGWLFRRVGEPWPGLAVRGLILAGAVAVLLFLGRLVRGEDLRRIAAATRRPPVERVLSRAADWIDRLQGRLAPTG